MLLLLQAPPPSKSSGSSIGSLSNVPVTVLSSAGALESNPAGYQGSSAAGSKASPTGTDTIEVVQLHVGLADSMEDQSTGQSVANAPGSSGAPADSTSGVLRIGIAVGITLAGLGVCAAAAVYFLVYRTAVAAAAADAGGPEVAAGGMGGPSGEPLTPRSAERAAEEEAKANAALSITLGPADDRY